MLQSDWIHFVFLNRIFCRIGSTFHHIGSKFRVTGMGVAYWVETWLPKMALAVASCSFSAGANGYNSKWTARECFKVLLSNETVAFLLGMVWHSFDATVSIPNYCQAHWPTKPVPGHIINTVSHSLGRAVQENIRFCIGPPYSQANTASLEPNVLLYCPPTRAIIHIYLSIVELCDAWVVGLD